MWVSTSFGGATLLMWFTFSLPYGPFVFVHKLLLFMGTCFFLADLQLLLLSNRGKGSYYNLSALSNKRGKLSEVEYPSLSKISFSFAYGYGKNINDTTLLYVVNLSTKGEGVKNPQNPVNIVHEWPQRDGWRENDKSYMLF